MYTRLQINRRIERNVRRVRKRLESIIKLTRNNVKAREEKCIIDTDNNSNAVDGVDTIKTSGSHFLLILLMGSPILGINQSCDKFI